MGEHIWDKQDASGLVHYTDAAFWDRLAGDLDERAHDGWDVEDSASEGSVSSWESGEDSLVPSTSTPGLHSRRSAPTRTTVRTNGRKSGLASWRHQSTPGSVDQSGGFAAVRKGVAGKIMRRWGATCGVSSSDTLLAVIDGQQPNQSRTGVGWVGEARCHSK